MRVCVSLCQDTPFDFSQSVVCLSPLLGFSLSLFPSAFHSFRESLFPSLPPCTLGCATRSGAFCCLPSTCALFLPFNLFPFWLFFVCFDSRAHHAGCLSVCISLCWCVLASPLPLVIRLSSPCSQALLLLLFLLPSPPPIAIHATRAKERVMARHRHCRH